jgi:hypothetical protein
MNKGRPVWLVFEDELSGALLHRLVREIRPQLTVDRAINTRGNARLLQGVPKYADMSRAGFPHLVLTDQDRSPCPPELLQRWKVPALPGLMLFRIAEREIESWLLADRQAFASLLGIPLAKVPLNPDALDDPKQELLNLVRRSKRSKLRREMLPAHGSAAPIGPGYNDILIGFVQAEWDIQRAAQHSPSLRRTVLRLGSF